jgi:DNA polymerase III delta prime subunit
MIENRILPCVVVVINEADNLTRDAQSALRRTMEKYSPNIRLILVANSSTKILAPIRSRCLLVRVAAPTNDDVVAALKGVVQAENLGKVGSGVLEKIAGESQRNLRRALLMLEAVYAQKYRRPLRMLWFPLNFVWRWGLRVVDDWMIRILRLYPLIGKSISNRLPTKLPVNSLCNGSIENISHLTVGSSKYELCSMNF